MISIPRMFSTFLDDDYLADAAAQRQSMVAKTDIHETEKDFVITVDLPGFQKDQLSIEVTSDNMVHLSGKRATKREDKDAKCHLRERQTMEFARSFRLPKDVRHDAVTASYVDGVLELVVPKVEKQTPDKVKVAI